MSGPRLNVARSFQPPTARDTAAEVAPSPANDLLYRPRAVDHDDRQAVEVGEVTASPPASRRSPMFRGFRLRRLIVPVLLVAAWCTVSYGGLIRPVYLPNPGAMWTAFELLRPKLPGAIATSTAMTVAGFMLGSALGVASGLALAYSRLLRDLFGQVLDLSRPVPVFAVIPLFILWFGIGRTPQIALITLGTSVVIGITTLDATRNINPLHLRAAATLGAGRWAVYRTVIVPSISPHMLGALRFAATASWGLDVAAELIGSQSGLGYLMIVQEQYLDTAGILVVVLVYALLATALDRIMVAVERPLMRWTYRAESETGDQVLP